MDDKMKNTICNTCKYAAVCLTCNGTAWLRVCSICKRVYGYFLPFGYPTLPLYFDHSCPLVVSYFNWLKLTGRTEAGEAGEMCGACVAATLERN